LLEARVFGVVAYCKRISQVIWRVDVLKFVIPALIASNI